MPRVHSSRRYDISTGDARSTQDAVIATALESLDTPRSLAVWLMYKYGEHKQLVDLDIDPARYSERNQFFSDYVATELLSKADFLSIDVDRKDVAIKKFLVAEEVCRETNKNLEFWATRGYPPRVGAALMGMRWKIAQILGSFRPDEFIQSSDWGPGATVTLPRNLASRYNKYGPRPSVTQSCCNFISPWFASAYPCWASAANLNYLSIETRCLDTQVVTGNKVTTVPKNAKTDRVICVEPTLNLFFQKGVGKMIRRRLSRCNPIDTQSRNQEFARRAVRDDLATVDFSSASDMIAFRLVEEVLPPQWFGVMRSLRSANGAFGSESFRWEKFSTMGNGYTFELETLLFLALAYHVCDVHGLDYSDVTVFGDDVILPSIALPLYIELSEALGFRVNREKTHVNSLFRESCGAHWFGGIDVKPLYIKCRPRSLTDLFKICNGIRHLSNRFNVGFGCDRCFRKSWITALRGIPERFRLFGPSQCGDSVIWENWDRVVPARCCEPSYEGWVVRTAVASQLHSRRSGLSLFPLRVGEIGKVDSSLGNLVPRPGKTKFKTQSIVVLDWHDPGEWI